MSSFQDFTTGNSLRVLARRIQLSWRTDEGSASTADGGENAAAVCLARIFAYFPRQFHGLFQPFVNFYGYRSFQICLKNKMMKQTTLQSLCRGRYLSIFMPPNSLIQCLLYLRNGGPVSHFCLVFGSHLEFFLRLTFEMQKHRCF